MMEGLLKPLYDIKEYRELLKALRYNANHFMVTGIFESQKIHIASGIIKELNKPSIFITFNELSAKKIYEDLKFFFDEKVLFYPSKELIPYDIEAEGLSLTAKRLFVLEKMLSHHNYIVVLSAEALQNKIIPSKIFSENIKKLKVGERYKLEELLEYFYNIGYKYSHMVEAKGQFSIRGEILDFFPVDSDNPYRIDFFDDEIDSIKTFDITSQRSISNEKEVTVLPAREIIFNKSTVKRAVESIRKDLEEAKKNIKDKNYSLRLEGKIMHDIEKINNNIFFAGLDKYISYFYDTVSILDYFPADGIIFIDEYNKVENTLETHFMQFEEMMKDSMEKGNVLPQCINSLFQINDIIKFINSRTPVIYLNTFWQNISGITSSRTFNILSKPIPPFYGKIDLLINQLKEWKKDNKKIVVLTGSKIKCEKLLEVLNENNIMASIDENFVVPPKENEIKIVLGSLYSGFEYSDINFIVVSDKEILGEKKKETRRRKIGQKIRTFTELNPNDYVVHHVHGIGQYLGIEKLKVEGVIKDYLRIKYLQGDLFVPVDQLDLIQKYIGSEGKQPKINKLGGADWRKIKSKVKASVRDLAKELIRLYAERQTMKGFAFPEDNAWQRQFEETFPYEETEDQLQCIKEVKEDMEKPRPMDRLLCGDVGYGKTEVAIRAAFKAVMGGKQVAYLVPTTILAQQHYNTFIQRMKDFPINIEMLSRFRTQSQQKKIVKDLKNGLIDIVIGTHRLLQKDVQFKDLGLVIVDEEQRFGVAHKEKLKSLKKNVDVLTLTATPIPRTLHMALVGVRDMSIIEYPPEDRYPVQTYVLEYNFEIIKDAIIREISRGGQVFYLHNRISTIHKVATQIQKLIPEAKVIAAHGKMAKNELEDIIIKFLNGEYNILVCTTIIETGIDMQNVNTIIIEDADKMGLAQLYQLRGRVGRSNRQAYAYFTFTKDNVLSEEAEKRLKAIKEFTEFGSGFKIAMRDLEIRGAGNLIGPEQHGHMNAVGYEMYCKILEDAIKELKGEKIKEKTETTIDINVSSYIDDEYINDPIQKINMYKKIASIESEEDVIDIKDELIDRYGDIPKEVNNLIEIAYIKSLCNNLNISSLSQEQDKIIITFNDIDNFDLKVIGEISDKFKKRILFTASTPSYLTYKLNGIPQDKILENIKILLQNFNKLQQ